MKKRFALVGTMAIFAGTGAAYQYAQDPYLTDDKREASSRGEDDGGACCYDWGCDYTTQKNCGGYGVFYEGQNCNEITCPEWGACCLWGDGCERVANEEECYAMKNGKYFQWGKECEQADFDVSGTQACCFDDESCQDLNYYDCYQAGGMSNNWAPCNEVTCLPPCDEWEIFSSVALPLTQPDCQSSEMLWNNYSNTEVTGHRIDFDGDGVEEVLMFHASYSYSNNTDPWNMMNNQAIILRKGEQVGSVEPLIILDVRPDNITYVGLDLPENYYYILHQTYLDVTGDGLVDAIVKVITSGSETGEFFYIENISTTTTACASDATGDGVVNVDDLIAMIADWGACP